MAFFDKDLFCLKTPQLSRSLPHVPTTVSPPAACQTSPALCSSQASTATAQAERLSATGHLQKGGQQRVERLAQIQGSSGRLRSIPHCFARLVTSWAETEEMGDARGQKNDAGSFDFCVIKQHGTFSSFQLYTKLQSQKNPIFQLFSWLDEKHFPFQAEPNSCRATAVSEVP